MTSPGLPAGVWWARLTGASGQSLTAVRGEQHADAAVVDVDAVDPTWDVLVVAHHDAVTDVVDQVDVPALPGAPALWFVGVPEPDAVPPAMTLVAFETDEVEQGRVLDAAALQPLATTRDQQVGAVRWWTASGVVDQVYVAPLHRRRKVAMTMLHAAAGYRAAKGWASLRAGGQRTELGQALASQDAPHWQHRVAPISHVLPPMTPPAQAVGVPERHLRPDPRDDRA